MERHTLSAGSVRTGPRVTGEKNDNTRIVRGPLAEDWKKGRTQQRTDGQEIKEVSFLFNGYIKLCDTKAMQYFHI